MVKKTEPKIIKKIELSSEDISQTKEPLSVEPSIKMSGEVSPQEAEDLIKKLEVLEIWDVRILIDWFENHLESARSMPFDEVIVNLEGCGCFTQIKTPRDTPILVYGDDRIVQVLERNGFTRIYLLVGGLDAWRQEGLPYLAPYAREYRIVMNK